MVRVCYGRHTGRTIVGMSDGYSVVFVAGVGDVRPDHVDEALRVPSMTLHPDETWPPVPPQLQPEPEPEPAPIPADEPTVPAPTSPRPRGRKARS